MIESAPHTPPGGGSRFRFTGSLRRQAARGTLINAAFTVGVSLLGLLKGFILARFLSRGDYGLWGIIAVSLSTLLWLKQAGIGDKFVQQDERDQELAFQRAFTLELALTGLCVAVIVIALPLLVVIYSLPQLVGPSLVVAAALVAAVFQAPLWIYYRQMDFGRQRALQAIDPVISFAVSITLAVAGAGYWAFVGGLLAGVCAASAAAVLSSPYQLRLRWTRGALRSYWAFSGPLLLAGVATFLMAWGAVIAAKLALGVAAVAVIALADNIASFTERVDDLVTGALYPAICAVRDQTELLYESLVKSNRLALMWAVPFGVGITLFCADLVHFGIGERWRPAVVVLQVYGVAAAINHIGFNWSAYFRALNRTRPIALSTVTATVVFLLTGIPLLLVMGLPGFAIGIAAQGLAALGLRAYYLQRLFPGFDFLRHAARSFLPTVPAAVLVLILRSIDGTRTLALALAELAAYVITAAAATWALERGLIREALAQLGRRGAAPAVS
ncbi:MAG: oligosaccharide flippase family protein [Solirubrobacteraceae bacterium]